jgi:hypothetical protein
MTLHDTLEALKEQIKAQDDGVKAIRGFDILASKCGDAYMKGQLVAIDGPEITALQAEIERLREALEKCKAGAALAQKGGK